MSDNPSNLSPPTLDLLCYELRDVVEWDQLAIYLKVPPVRVACIRREYNDVQQRKMYALQKWLQQDDTVHSWRVVADAVKLIYPVVAECIEEKYALVLDEVSNQSTLQGNNCNNEVNQRRGYYSRSRNNVPGLLMISLSNAVIVVVIIFLIIFLIVLFTYLIPKISTETFAHPMTTMGEPMYKSASSTLITSSLMTSSLSPTPSPTPSPIPEPASVENFEVVPLSNNSVIVSWEQPQEITFIIYNLIIKRWDGQGHTQYFGILATQQLIQVVSSLNPYTPYTATLYATNNQGQLQGQPTSKTFFTRQNIPPIAPENLTAIRIDYTTLNVSWTQLTLDEAQGIILSYQLAYVGVSWYIKNYEIQIKAPANTSYVLIGGLYVQKQYKVKIAAVTIAGVGKFSDFVYEDDYPTSYKKEITGNAGGLCLLITLFLIDMLCFLQM